MEIKVKGVKPMFDRIVTTMDRYDNAQKVNGIIIPTKVKGGIKEFQKVISVGSFVKNVSPGDVICINPTAYGKPVHKNANSIKGLSDEYDDQVEMVYRFPTVKVNGEDFLFISERDVDYVVTDYEEIKENDSEPVIQVINPIISPS